ncbi:MAG: vitamin K epoxide reductase family protein [Pyrinomonadaceae bacterium]
MTEEVTAPVKRTIAKLPLAAAVVALAGLADAVYLTAHHYNAEPVPCGAAFDCEMVLTSPFATLGGIVNWFRPETLAPTGSVSDIPLAAFGAAAYFVAFALATLTAFGDQRMWKPFGAQVVMMAAFSGWLIYVQAALIGAFCQFCLISAATTFTLLILFVVSLFLRPKTS